MPVALVLGWLLGGALGASSGASRGTGPPPRDGTWQRQGRWRWPRWP
jgi:hypothetical protein